ncbi:MAG: hypothetical protein WD645_07185 [Dehalococcoidia bacterium]
MFEIDGSAMVAIACWFMLWVVLVGAGFILTQREKQRGEHL